jgi:hypothetical protein
MRPADHQQRAGPARRLVAGVGRDLLRVRQRVTRPAGL